jgi:probable rRNA maturation factor
VKSHIHNSSGVPIPLTFLNWWLKQLSRELKIKSGILGLAFVKPMTSKKLNLKYRRKNRPTDVLSFELGEAGYLGELVICPQVVRKQAKAHGQLFREELGYMVLHGVLHLMGYDHERSQREAKVMFSLQDAIFERLLQKYSRLP